MCTYSIRKGAGQLRKISKYNINPFASSKRDINLYKHVFKLTRLVANLVDAANSTTLKA